MMVDDARHDLVERITVLRAYVSEEIGTAALVAEPNKTCARLIAGLLDNLNNLEALLSR